MSYKISWLLENRILLISYDGVLSKVDLQTYLAESMDMRDRANAILTEGGPFVHTITDARRMTRTELSLNEALKTMRIVRNQRVGWTVYIPAKKLDMFFATLGHQFAGVRYRNAESIAEAIAFLKTVDETLAHFTYVGEDAPASTAANS